LAIAKHDNTSAVTASGFMLEWISGDFMPAFIHILNGKVKTGVYRYPFRSVIDRGKIRLPGRPDYVNNSG
jgi:hypothetical protein